MDKLESDIQKYRDKINDIEFFKSRVDELREDNRLDNKTELSLQRLRETEKE